MTESAPFKYGITETGVPFVYRRCKRTVCSLALDGKKDLGGSDLPALSNSTYIKSVKCSGPI